MMAGLRLWIFFLYFPIDLSLLQPKNEYSGASLAVSMGDTVKHLFGPFLTFLELIIGPNSHFDL